MLYVSHSEYDIYNYPELFKYTITMRNTFLAALACASAITGVAGKNHSNR